MIQLQPHENGTILPVRAQAGARKNGITGAHNGMLKVSVGQAPEKGKANKAIAEVLSKTLGVSKSQIDLVAGGTSPEKKFLIRNVGIDELRNRVETVLRGSAGA